MLGLWNNKWVHFSVLALIVMVSLLVGIRMWLGSPYGAQLIQSQIEGRTLGSLGEIEIEGLRGDIFSDLTARRIAIRDEEGVWLEIENLSLQWHARALISRHLDIDDIRAQKLSLYRRPSSDATGSSNSGGLSSLPRIDIETAQINEIFLAENVVGPETRLRLSAALQGGLSTPGDIEVRLEHLERADEFFTLNATHRPDGQIEARLALEAPEGGSLAHLMGMAQSRFSLSAALEGDQNAGQGTLNASLNGEAVGTGDISWNETRWQALLDTQLHRLPHIPEQFSDLVRQTHIEASGPWPKPQLREIAVQTDSLSMRLSRQAPTSPWQGQADLTEAALAVFLPDTLSVSSLHLSGQFMQARGPLFEGDVRTHNLTSSYGEVEHLDGQMTLARENSAYQVRFNGQAEGANSTNTRLNAILAETPLSLSGVGEWQGDRRRVTWQEVEISNPTLALASSGSYELDAKAITLEAQTQVKDAHALHPDLQGGVEAQLSAEGTLSDLGYVLEIEGQTLQPTGRLAALGDNLTGEAQGRWRDQRLAVDTLTVQSSQLHLEAHGGQSEDGQWQTQGQLAFHGETGLPSLTLTGGLVTAFEVIAHEEGLETRLVSTTQALQAGPLTFVRPELTVESHVQDENLTGQWQFTGEARGQALDFTGTFNRTGSELSLDSQNGQIGLAEVEFAARLLEQTLSAQIVARKDQGLSQWQGQVDYVGRLDNLRAGQVESQADFSRLAFGGATLDQGNITASGTLDALNLALSIEGRAQKSFILNSTGQLSWPQDGPLRVELIPHGEWGFLNWTSLDPVLLHHGPEGQSLIAHLGIAEGRLNLEAGLGTLNQDPDFIRFQAEALPAQILSGVAGLPLLSGTIEGDLDLTKPGPAWQGHANLGFVDIKGESLPDETALSAQFTAQIRDDLILEGELTGPQIQGRMTLERTGPTESLGAWLGPEGAHLNGQVELDGGLQSLAQLFLPEGQRAEGHIRLDATLEGPVGNPLFEGRLNFEEGVFEVAASGTRLEALEFAANFSGPDIRIDTVSARDGQGGTLTGQARIDLDETGLLGEAQIDFNRLQAVARRDVTAIVTGSAQFDLNADRLHISGRSTLNRVDARPPEASGPSIARLDVREINTPRGLKEASTARRAITLDYTIEADDDIFVAARNFNSEWRANIHVGGTAHKVNVQGAVNLIQGQAFLVNRPFTLREGEVRFSGQPNNARLDITAVHQRPNFEAQIEVGGRIRAPEISLSSTPDLPEDEIFSRLLFDRSAAQLGALETAQLAAQLSGQNIFGVMGNLRNLTGLDRLNVSTGAQGGVVVTGGRKLSDDVYVELETGDGAAFGAAKVEWTLTPDLSLLSRLTGDTNASIALQWKTEY